MRSKNKGIERLEVWLFGDVEVRLGGETILPVHGPSSTLNNTDDHLLAYMILCGASAEPAEDVYKTREQRKQEKESMAKAIWPEAKDPYNTQRRRLTAVRGLLGRDRIPEAYKHLPRLSLRDADYVDYLEFRQAVMRGDAVSLKYADELFRRGPLVQNCHAEWIATARDQVLLDHVSVLVRLAKGTMALCELATSESYLRQAIEGASSRTMSSSREKRRRRLLRQAHLRLMAVLVKGLRQTAAAKLRKSLTNLAPREECYVQQIYERFDKPLALKLKDVPPEPPATFVSRTDAAREVKRLLHTTPLVTITGFGGIGKTQLALQVARELAPCYVDGVTRIRLDAVSDPKTVTLKIHAALEVSDQGPRSPEDKLVNHLRSKQLLLVLDSCERLMSECARLADILLPLCSGLRLLATSHERLQPSVARATGWPLPRLSVPPHRPMPLMELKEYEAVRMFVAYATDCRKTFTASERNAEAIADICRRLEGIPLALRLAAAWVERFDDVAEIARRLKDRFQFLIEGPDSPARHETLQAAIDWSHELLNDLERTLLRRLSVFRGGWSQAAAENVCVGGGIEVNDVVVQLHRLKNKSFIEEEETQGGRYWMLDTIREYEWARLETAGEHIRLCERHLDFYLRLAEKAEPELVGKEQGLWLDRLETEQDNLRAALEWSVMAEGNAEKGLRLAGALSQFWYQHSHLSEGRQRLEAALSKTEEIGRAAARAKALNGVGVLAREQGDFSAARVSYEESLAIRRELGVKSGIAESLNNLGSVAHEQGNHDSARSLYEESLDILWEVKDKRGIAVTLSNLGVVAHEQGDYATARASYEESLAILRELGDKWVIAALLNNLGGVMHDQGDYALARTRYEESLAINRELRNRVWEAYNLHNLGLVAKDQSDCTAAWALFEESLGIRLELKDKPGIAESLEGLAALAIAQKQPERAARLYGAAEVLRQAVGAPLSPIEHAKYESNVIAARIALGEEMFAATWTEGRAMTLEQAVEYALANQATD